MLLVGTPRAGVNAFGASVGVSVDPAVQNGDLMLAMSNGYGTTLGPATPSAPAGWTSIGVNKSTGLTGSTALGVYYRYASSEPASYTFANDDSSALHYIAAGMVILRSSAANPPFEVPSLAAHGSGSPVSSADPGATTDDYCWFMLFASTYDQFTATPADFLTDITYDGSPPANFIGHKVIHPPGATGTRSFSINLTDDTVIWAVVIAPLAGSSNYYFPHWYNSLRVN